MNVYLVLIASLICSWIITICVILKMKKIGRKIVAELHNNTKTPDEVTDTVYYNGFNWGLLQAIDIVNHYLMW